MGLEEGNEVTALLLTVNRGPACLLKEAILPTWPLEPRSNPLGKSTDELLQVKSSSGRRKGQVRLNPPTMPLSVAVLAFGRLNVCAAAALRH